MNPPTQPKPGFPKTAAEAAAETAGEIRGAGGSAGGIAAETAGGTAFALRSRETAVPPPVSAAFLPASPPAPGISRQFPQQSPQQFRGIRAWGLLWDGRGNGKTSLKR